jgi:hypothetical protein
MLMIGRGVAPNDRYSAGPRATARCTSLMGAGDGKYYIRGALFLLLIQVKQELEEKSLTHLIIGHSTFRHDPHTPIRLHKEILLA